MTRTISIEDMRLPDSCSGILVESVDCKLNPFLYCGCPLKADTVITKDSIRRGLLSIEVNTSSHYSDQAKEYIKDGWDMTVDGDYYVLTKEGMDTIHIPYEPKVSSRLQYRLIKAGTAVLSTNLSEFTFEAKTAAYLDSEMLKRIEVDVEPLGKLPEILRGKLVKVIGCDKRLRIRGMQEDGTIKLGDVFDASYDMGDELNRVVNDRVTYGERVIGISSYPSVISIDGSYKIMVTSLSKFNRKVDFKISTDQRCFQDTIHTMNIIIDEFEGEYKDNTVNGDIMVLQTGMFYEGLPSECAVEVKSITRGFSIRLGDKELPIPAFLNADNLRYGAYRLIKADNSELCHIDFQDKEANAHRLTINFGDAIPNTPLSKTISVDCDEEIAIPESEYKSIEL